MKELEVSRILGASVHTCILDDITKSGLDKEWEGGTRRSAQFYFDDGMKELEVPNDNKANPYYKKAKYQPKTKRV
jgi:hypothetical protein